MPILQCAHFHNASLRLTLFVGGAPIEELINLSIDDDEAVDVKSETSGAYSMDSTKSSKSFSPSNEP